MRLLGCLALCAFISYWIQVEGLIGSEGILPVADYIEKTSQALDEYEPQAWKFARLPTIFWLNSSDLALHLAFGAGVAASVALIIGVCPALASLAIWLLYLSLTIAGQDFLTFQWDILLIETSFLAIFLAPWKGLDRLVRHPAPSRLARWLLWLLLFRLMFESGIAKLWCGRCKHLARPDGPQLPLLEPAPAVLDQLACPPIAGLVSPVLTSAHARY